MTSKEKTMNLVLYVCVYVCICRLYVCALRVYNIFSMSLVPKALPFYCYSAHVCFMLIYACDFIILCFSGLN